MRRIARDATGPRRTPSTRAIRRIRARPRHERTARVGSVSVRVVLLNSPSSGSGSGPSGDELAAMLRAAGADEVTVMSIDEGVDAVGPGVDRVVLASGDGGVGPAAQAAGAAGVPLAVIPSGTANDFAARMRLPRD